MAPQWYAAPLALAAGLTYDSGALRAAADLLGAPDLALLDRAGRVGFAIPSSRGSRRTWWRSRSKAARASAPADFDPADLEQARAFFDRYTRRGRCPADDGIRGRSRRRPKRRPGSAGLNERYGPGPPQRRCVGPAPFPLDAPYVQSVVSHRRFDPVMPD